VRLDRTAPTVPATVTGGSATWQSVASVTISGSGSTDALSGVDHYQHRTSTDGTTWTSAATGSSVTVTAEADTQVEFRAVDAAGNAGNWTTVGATARARIDRTAPTVPTVSGGAGAWQNVASVTITGSAATDALSGLAAPGYEYETSFNGGAWSTPATSGTSVSISAEGTTTVRFRSVDNAGNRSAWSTVGNSSTAMIDRTPPAAPASVTGGSSTWSAAASATITASGGTDSGSGVSGYQYETSFNGGAWSGPTAGATAPISAEGTTTVQFRTVDNTGNVSGWSPVTAATTVKLDRTAPAAATASGGSLSWQNIASVTVNGSATDGGSGINAATYQYRTSTNGGSSWSAAASGSSLTVSGEGETLVQFRATDNAGNVGAWGPAADTAGATIRLDRSPPTLPATVSGGSANWSSAATMTVTASGGTDSGSGVAGYQYETSLNGGAWSSPTTASSVTVSAQGTTTVQFRTVDVAGNTSGWTAVAAGSTVKLDHTLPTTPTTVAGGSGNWSTGASMTVTASGSTDSGGAGLLGYQYETSFNNGAYSAPQTGASLTISVEGTTKVIFRSIDNAGNVSAWTTAGNSSTAKLDRTAPSVPTVTGGWGTSTCKNTTIRIKGSGSTDATSGVKQYNYHYSTNGGTSWTLRTNSTQTYLTSAGSYIVQFQAVDNAGNTSAWGPSVNGTANTACHS